MCKTWFTDSTVYGAFACGGIIQHSTSARLKAAKTDVGGPLIDKLRILETLFHDLIES